MLCAVSGTSILTWALNCVMGGRVPGQGRRSHVSMEIPGPENNGLPPTENRREFRKRKIRKGTQSCWECKRRKTKCHFTASTNATCDGCKRRGTRCVGQEFPEDPSSNRQQLRDRLGRVEELVGQLAQDQGARVGDAESRSLHANGQPACPKGHSPDLNTSELSRVPPQSSYADKVDGLGQDTSVSGSRPLEIIYIDLTLPF